MTQLRLNLFDFKAKSLIRLQKDFNSHSEYQTILIYFQTFNSHNDCNRRHFDYNNSLNTKKL